MIGISFMIKKIAVPIDTKMIDINKLIFNLLVEDLNHFIWGPILIRSKNGIINGAITML